MKYLLIGIWHGERPHVQTHPTDRLEDAGGATFSVTRRADRLDVPDVVLLIDNQRGPKVAYRWEKNIHVLQSQFDENLEQMLSDGGPKPDGGDQ